MQNNVERSGNVRQDALAAVFRMGRDLALVQKVSALVKQAELDGRAADVDTETVFHNNTSFLW